MSRTLPTSTPHNPQPDQAMATYSTKYLLNRYFPELDIPRLALESHAAENDVYQILRAVGVCAAERRRLGRAEDGLVDEAIGQLNATEVAMDMGMTEQAVRRILHEVQAQLQKQRETAKCAQVNGSTSNSTNNILNDKPQDRIQGTRVQGNTAYRNNAVSINNSQIQAQRTPILVNHTGAGGRGIDDKLNSSLASSNSQLQIVHHPAPVDFLLSQIRTLFTAQYRSLTTPNPPGILHSIFWPDRANEFAEFIPRTFAHAIKHSKRTKDGHVLLHVRDVDTLQKGLNLLSKRAKEQWNNLMRTAEEYQKMKKDIEKQEKKLKKQQEKASTKDTETMKPSRAKKSGTVVQQSPELTQPAPTRPQLSRLITDPQFSQTDGQGRLDALEISPVRPPHIRVGMDGVARPVVYGMSASEFNAATTATAPTTVHGLSAPRRNNGLVPNPEASQTQDCGVTDGEHLGSASHMLAPSPRINDNINAATDNTQLSVPTKTPTGGNTDKTAGKHDILRTPGNSPVAKRTKVIPKPKVKKSASATSLRGEDDDVDKENGNAPISPATGLLDGED